MADARPVLIVDGANLFVRSFCAYPTMSSHGYQMGGCIGFLKTLRRIVSEVQPSAIYICWEAGGSARRRALFTEYKLGRRPEKLNRFYEDDIPDTDDNRRQQMISLLAFVKCIPACQIYVPDCEGDDEIAYLCSGPLNAVDKVIVSSDKDLYQLLDDRTKMYSLHKKTFVTKELVHEEYRITAMNFAVAKALCGDPGDNVPGVKGVGFKKASTLFPFLGIESSVILDDVFGYCHTHIEESTLYKRVLDSKEDIKRNWKLVFLDGSMLAASQQAKIDSMIQSYEPNIDKMGFIKKLIKEGVGDFDVEGFFYSFCCIDGLTYSTGDK